MRKRGQKPFNAKALKQDGGQYVENEFGRIIEYVVFGARAQNQNVIVTLHGSGPEAMSEATLHEQACKALDVKGIAISLPGFGYTDFKPGRQIKDWPSEDLQPILEKEAVGDFMITGHSQGTPHAMAAALHFKKRCVGLGLNAPFLPANLTKELGLKGAPGMDSLFMTETLKRFYMAWYFGFFYLLLDLLCPWIPMVGLRQTCPAVVQDDAYLKIMRATFKRAKIRSAVGNAWESAKDVCYHWGFDLRLIETKNICVWHAADDNLNPPEQGEWLAKYFEEKGAHVNFKNDNQGFDHFTFSRGAHLKPEHSMLKALLDGLEKTSS